MRGVLEFNLPEEEYEFYLASSAGKLANALRDIGHFLRNKEKYGEADSILIRDMRQVFFDAVEGINLDE